LVLVEEAEAEAEQGVVVLKALSSETSTVQVDFV
jgi:hypothetical protein